MRPTSGDSPPQCFESESGPRTLLTTQINKTHSRLKFPVTLGPAAELRWASLSSRRVVSGTVVETTPDGSRALIIDKIEK